MRKCVILWDNDIGWSEELQRELLKEGVTITEAESAVDFLQETGVEEKIREIALLAEGESALAVVLSASQIEDELSGSFSINEKEKVFVRWQEVLQKLCASCPVPVLFVAEEYEEKMEWEALQTGVFDFYDKKRDIRICVQRILLCSRKWENRRVSSGSKEKNFILDDKRQCVIYDGREYMLTQKEYQVFTILFEKKESIVSRQELLTAGWGAHLPKGCRVVDTIIKQLRTKIKDTPYRIYSKYRMGYYITVTGKPEDSPVTVIDK